MDKSITAIYVEDDDEWRENVKSYVQRHSRVKFSRFIARSSIAQAQADLNSVSGPLVIIMDLRLGSTGKLYYRGYHWLLEKLQNKVSTNASTTAFVISGYLHEGIKETLMLRGIPKTHLFDKSEWAEKRDEFITLLNEAVSKMDEIALENINIGAAGSTIDPYLLHTFEAVQENALNESNGKNIPKKVLPMLIRTKNKTWDYKDIPDLEVLGQVDNIFACSGSMKSIVALERDKNVIDVESSRFGGIIECEQSIPFVKADLIHSSLKGNGDKCIVAFIDNGVDILHEAFQDPVGKKTRILAVWDQTDPQGPPPTGQKIGTFHSEDFINSCIQKGRMPERLKPRDNHGTHVISIAAGSKTSMFTGGIAQESKIIVVIPNMDVDPDRPKSIGYSNSHLLALRFIRDFADERNLPVVINVSQGMNAGAHDGTSNLEKMFDAITDNGRIGGIVIVKSAGNERNQNGHAGLHLSGNSVDTLEWFSKDTPRFDDVIELWFNSNDLFVFRLVNPSLEKTDYIDLANPKRSGHFTSGNSYKITYTKYDPDNGDSRLLISIYRGSVSTMESGKWSLEIESQTIKASGEIHAWVERDSARSLNFLKHVSDNVTISVPGTAFHTITVGSVAKFAPFRLAEYSSFGPTRDGRNKPDLSAPGEEIVAAKNDNDLLSLSGTSMAAPHVSGAIALLFSHIYKEQFEKPETRQLNASQIQKIITQTTQNYSVMWHPGMGYGVLDVDALLREFIVNNRSVSQKASSNFGG